MQKDNVTKLSANGDTLTLRTSCGRKLVIEWPSLKQTHTEAACSGALSVLTPE